MFGRRSKRYDEALRACDISTQRLRDINQELDTKRGLSQSKSTHPTPCGEELSPVHLSPRTQEDMKCLKDAMSAMLPEGGVVRMDEDASCDPESPLQYALPFPGASHDERKQKRPLAAAR